MKHVFLLLLSVLTLCSCAAQEPVTIASKEFSENRILAHMFTILARESGIQVKTAIPYGNTFDLQKAIKDGRVDAYPEYTGTGLSMMGMTAMSNRDKAMSAVRDIFSRYDIRWLQRLGFDNSYVMVMRPDMLARMEVATINELADKREKVTIGVEQEFMARPVDGFPALIRRYGFNPEPEAVVVESRVALYRKLVSEQIDAAVTYRSDPQIQEFGLAVLQDDLQFFPAYEAAPLVREKALARHPRLEEALNQLSGLVDNAAIRELNRKVMLDGHDPRTVAEDFLVRHGLYEHKPPELESRELRLALPPSGHRSTLLAKALDTIRQVFPNRAVDVSFTDTPVESMMEGRTFMAMLGAESFYSVQPGQLPELKENVEALVPVGFRAVHLIKRDTRITPMPFGGIKELGVGPQGGSSEQAARILLDAYGLNEDIKLVNGDPEELALSVLKGTLDGLLIMAPLGDARMVRILDRTRLSLQPMSQWNKLERQYRYPFFRSTRLAVDLYPGMSEPVDTIGAQVVLAGPAPEKAVLGDGDPVSGLQTHRQQIPRGVKESLAAEIEATETIDPMLPGERITLVSARRDIQPINPEPEVSILSAVFLLALGLFFVRMVRR